MSKRYELRRIKVSDQAGGFFEAFIMALVDLACLGEKNLDLTGYPHDSVGAALASDWAALGTDFNSAVRKVSAESHEVRDAVRSAVRRPRVDAISVGQATAATAAVTGSTSRAFAR
jgi:hypothetical protein